MKIRRQNFRHKEISLDAFLTEHDITLVISATYSDFAQTKESYCAHLEYSEGVEMLGTDGHLIGVGLTEVSAILDLERRLVGERLIANDGSNAVFYVPKNFCNTR